MKLEMAAFPVKEIALGKKTAYRGNVLTINKDELIKIIKEDKRIAFADIELAFPGEKTRIVKLTDAVEPRIKTNGPGCVFPGILGPIETVGDGRTHRLSGMAVLTSAEYKTTITSGTAAYSTGIVDMWGNAARLTPFGSTNNVVLKVSLVDGVTELEAHNAIQLAEMKLAKRLAEVTVGQESDNTEVFELVEADPGLPRIAYILTCLTEWHHPHSGVAYYGLPIRESLPTLMHPNEILDGAITKCARRGGGSHTTTWAWQVQPVIMDLLRKHGKELNFLGVILQRTRFESEFGKKVSAACASQMARLLEADGVVITRIVTSGNNFMDLMLTVQACEQKGIKTTFLTPEWGGKDGTELPLVFYVPEATAMVSSGSFERDVYMAVPDKVIGVGNTDTVQLYAGDKKYPPHGEFTLPAAFCLLSGVDWFGYRNLTCTQY